MIIIGIDPGVTGAMAFMRGQSYMVLDLPILQRGTSKWVDSYELGEQLLVMLRWFTGNSESQIGDQEMIAYIEHVHAMPKQQGGTKSAHLSGLILGSVVATLQMARIPFELISPVSWKKHFALLGGKDLSATQRKLLSLSAARMRYPKVELGRQKDHNRAEALLIAGYGMSKQRSIPVQHTHQKESPEA